MRAYLIEIPGKPPRMITVEADARREARAAGGSSSPLEIPNTKQELIPWLNEFLELHGSGGLVAIGALELEAPAIADGERPWIKGPPTKDPPRVSPAFLGDVDGQTEFVPIAKAAEIDRYLQRCPRCHGSVYVQVLSWISEAPIDDLQRVAEHIKEHVAELREQIEEGVTRQ